MRPAKVTSWQGGIEQTSSFVDHLFFPAAASSARLSVGILSRLSARLHIRTDTYKTDFADRWKPISAGTGKAESINLAIHDSPDEKPKAYLRKLVCHFYYIDADLRQRPLPKAGFGFHLAKHPKAQPGNQTNMACHPERKSLKMTDSG